MESTPDIFTAIRNQYMDNASPQLRMDNPKVNTFWANLNPSKLQMRVDSEEFVPQSNVVCFNSSFKKDYPKKKAMNSILSMRHHAHFTIVVDTKSVTFKSVKQWVIYMKAWLFGTKTQIDEVLKNGYVNSKLNEIEKNIVADPSIWSGAIQSIVLIGTIAKFNQNLTMKKFLLSLNGKMIAYAKKDKAWGTGLLGNDPNIQYPCQWPGNNLHGEILMEVRDQYLRSEFRTPEINMYLFLQTLAYPGYSAAASVFYN